MKSTLNIYRLLILSSITILLALSLLGCSSSEQITGQVIDTSITASGKVSLLLVKVVDEKNQPLGDVGIYLNGIYKGKTNSYGESKGTKEIILNQEENMIRTEKNGYFPGRQETIQALPDQKQSITLTLTKEITTLAVRILDEDNFPVESATVMLLADEDTKNTNYNNYNKKNSDYNKNKQDNTKKVLISDENGFVFFKRIEDGPYLVKVSKGEYGLSQKKVEIRYSEHGAEAKIELNLALWPTLKLIIKNQEQVLLQDAEVSLYYENDYHQPGALPSRVEYSSGEGITAFKDIALNQGYVIVIKKEGFESKTINVEMGDEEVKLNVEMEVLVDSEN